MNKKITNKSRKKRADTSLSKVELLVKGVATGIAVSAITHAGRGVFAVISRQTIAIKESLHDLVAEAEEYANETSQ